MRDVELYRQLLGLESPSLSSRRTSRPAASGLDENAVVGTELLRDLLAHGLPLDGGAVHHRREQGAAQT